jgi:hypothetical protein
MRKAILILLLLLPPSAFAQWVDRGTLPTPQGTTLPCGRSWGKPVFDTVHNKLIFYLANPNCCSGTFSNALFGYTVTASGAQQWTKYYTNGKTASSGGAQDTATDPVSLHPYRQITWDSTRNGIWKIDGSAQCGTGATSTICGSNSCGDCAVSDNYFFNASTISWTQVCGMQDGAASACPSILGTNPPSTVGAMVEMSMAYDATNDIIVVYSGKRNGFPNGVMFTYKLDAGPPAAGGGIYTQRCTSCTPGVLHQTDMIPIGGGKIVLYGGCTVDNSCTGGVTGCTNEAYVLNTSTFAWTHVTSATKPPAQCWPVCDRVAELNCVVCIDNNQSGAHVWALNATTLQWSDLNIATGPTLTTNPASGNQGGYDPVAKRFVLLIAGGNSNANHVWQLTLPAGTTPTKMTNVLTQEMSWTHGSHSANNRTTAPVTVGMRVPDSPGIDCTVGGSPTMLMLQNNSGTQLNSQFRCLGKWPSGNAMWVLVDYQIPKFTAGGVDATLNLADISSGGGNNPSTVMSEQYSGFGTPEAYCQNVNQYLVRTQGTYPVTSIARRAS